MKIKLSPEQVKWLLTSARKDAQLDADTFISDTRAQIQKVADEEKNDKDMAQLLAFKQTKAIIDNEEVVKKAINSAKKIGKFEQKFINLNLTESEIQTVLIYVKNEMQFNNALYTCIFNTLTEIITGVIKEDLEKEGKDPEKIQNQVNDLIQSAKNEAIEKNPEIKALVQEFENNYKIEGEILSVLEKSLK